MSIGIYDYDYFNYTHVMPNLECAKLCAYFRQHNTLATISSYFNPDPYNQYYIRKDYDDGKYDKNFHKKNIIYGGRAYSPDKYIPLDLDIEATRPNMENYKKYSQFFVENKKDEDIIKHLLLGEHLRLSLDGQNIWSNFEKQLNITTNTRGIFFHDYDLNKIYGAIDVIKELTKIKNHQARVGMKFPVQINTIEEFYKWFDIAPSMNTFFLQYNGFIPNEVLVELVEKNRQLSKVFYYNPIINNFNEDVFYNELLPNIFDQVLFLHNQGIKILLYIDNKNFSIPQDVVVLFKLFSNYSNAQFMTTHTNSLFRFIKSDDFNKYLNYNIPQLRMIFNNIRKKNYDLFKKFYEVDRVKYQGGKFIDDTPRN